MNKTVVIDIVGLSASLIGEHTPFLKQYIEKRHLTYIRPVLPAVTTTSQSCYVTGKWPSEHGIVGNGWYDREDAEVKFWKQSNKLVQAEKMAFLGELTAGIAHELQNPLNFVKNFAEVSTDLVDEITGDPRGPARDAGLEQEILAGLKQNLQKISQHGQRASSIIKGMLEHSRSGTSQREPTNLNRLVDESLRLAYQGLRTKEKDFSAQLTTDFDPDLPAVLAVPQDLSRVLINLCTNAFHAVEERQRQHPDGSYQPEVAVSTQATAGGVQIRVRDNGIGMPEHVKAKIFQPFFTTKPAGQGTGLGLSLSHDIVTTGHRGTLAVESEEGKGTEFVVTLPT